MRVQKIQVARSPLTIYCLVRHSTCPHDPCCQSGPHIQSTDNVSNATLPRTHSHCRQLTATLPSKLLKSIGNLCSWTGCWEPFVQDTKRVDSQLRGITTTGKTQLDWPWMTIGSFRSNGKFMSIEVEEMHYKVLKLLWPTNICTAPNELLIYVVFNQYI